MRFLAAKNGGKIFFGEKSPDDSADTPNVKNFAEIALFCTIFEINLFFRFTQKFKMATKTAGKRCLGNGRQKW